MKMLEELSSLYSEIVARTLEVAPVEWKRLWLNIDCAEGSWGVGGYWECEGTDQVIFFQIPDSASDLIYDSWKVNRANNNRWSTALFCVDRPAALKITFGYEDLNDESYSPVEDQAAFRKRTFGDRPIRSTIDMSGATSLTPEMLTSGTIGPSP